MVEVSTNKYSVVFEDIQQAHQRIKGHVNATPVMTFDFFDKLVPCKLHFKCESFQKTGSFKFRGAFNSVSKLIEKISPDDISVLAHSSGNHGQALALAAKLCNVKANIVMPTNAPLSKVEAVKGYGATVISCASTEKAREEKAEEVIKETNGYMVHSSQNPEVIAGQGTIALEFLQQVPNLDAIVATVGGGGLLSGICLAAKALKPSIKIYAAEPEMADDCARSMKANRHLKNNTYPDTVADGLRVSIGEVTWPILRDHLDDVILVTEEDICDNLRLVLEKAKLLVEPSAAVGVAAVRSSHFKRLIDEHQLTQVGVVLCGGNIDAARLKTII